MKKVILGLVAAAAVPMMLSAQGTIAFNTQTANHKIVYQTNAAQGVGSGYVAALYWGTQGSTEAQLIQIGATTPVTATTGFLATPATRTTGAGTPEGGVGTFQVRAWNDGFADWNAANASGLATTQVGKSALFTNGTGAPNGTPTPTPPSSLAGWTTPVGVNFVPEPSTLALAGLGAVAMLVFRRRK